MEIKIGDKFIGEDNPVFVIAEAGVNHATEINGVYQKSVERAKQLIDVAKNAGADAVKFQTFDPIELILPGASSAQYHKDNMGENHDWYKSLESEKLSFEDFKELTSYCKQKEIIFLSTPYDQKSVELLEELNVPAYKIASTDTNNIPLLKYIARKNKPIILSTGMATLEEISESVKSINEEGNYQVILLHCVANYPIKIDECNLKVMETLKTQFNLLIGYSDHSLGYVAPMSAVARGAHVIEKHITLNKNDSGPDHKASLEPLELKEMIQKIRETEKTLGDGIKKLTDSEIKNKDRLRKSVVSLKYIEAGETITEKMIGVKRPGTGLAPKYLELIIGKRAKLNIKKDRVVKYGDVVWE